MPNIMSGNWICVRQGDPAFSIGTNVCGWFELGVRHGADYWLEGQVVGDGEFLFNGRLFLPGVTQAGTVIDNFPKGPAPKGWTKRPRVDGNGYELESDGTVPFGYRVVSIQIPGLDTESRICFVTVNLYGSNGALVAEVLPEEFRLHRHPAKIGRGGLVFT
jgi:hypothetical protein